MRRERPSPRPDLTGDLSFRVRVPLPVVIPLAALAVIALIAIAFSRVLLALQPEAATAVALVTAANVLVACAVIAARPNMARSTVIEIILVAFYPLLVGVVLAQTGYAAKTEAGAETHVAEAASESGGEGAPAQGAPSEGEGTAAPAQEATLAASGTAFDTQELSLAPDATVTLDNQDPFVHNFAVYESEQAAQSGDEAIFTSPDVQGSESADFTVKAPPGEYFFQCDYHPTMSGTVVIGEGGGAATADKPKAGAGEKPKAGAGDKPSGGGAAPAGPVQLTAQSTLFDTQEIAISAGAPAKVTLDNQDDFPHNFAVYESEQEAEGGQALFTSPTVDGGQSSSFSVKPPAPGEYFFRCDFHPTTMTGTLTVE